MSYEYDENNGLQPKPPKKNNNDCLLYTSDAADE